MDIVDREWRGQALGPYRALDLTEGGYNWCGKVLADLGADVIKVEPPGGSPTRHRPPFYKDQLHPERSLYWLAYCANKRSVTLNLESRDGREIFGKLVATADFVLESFQPGYMDSLGVSYETLSRINPGLIVTSMTPFGLTGPHAKYKGADIVAMAMGGLQYVSGDEDRPPVRISFPQAELHGGAQGAAGSMTAFWHRQRTGEGQRVDVSTQVAITWTLMNATPFPKLHKTNVERAGVFWKEGHLLLRMIYPCKDGYVSTILGGGGFGPSTAALVRWMDEEGLAPDFMKERDWPAWDFIEMVASGEEGQKDLETIQDHVAGFFNTKSKAELYQRAIADKILLAPCNSVQDVDEDIQLNARGFWIEVYYPEVDDSLIHLGPYIRLSESPLSLRRRPPGLGEHNDEIYVDELGFSKEQLVRHRGLGVI